MPCAPFPFADSLCHHCDNLSCAYGCVRRLGSLPRESSNLGTPVPSPSASPVTRLCHGWRTGRPPQRLSGGGSGSSPGKHSASHSAARTSSKMGCGHPLWLRPAWSTAQWSGNSPSGPLVPVMEADVESPNTCPQAVDLSPPSGEGPPRPASWLPHEPCAGTPIKVSSRFCVAQPGRHLSRYSAHSGHPEPRAGRVPAFPGEGLDGERRPSHQGPPLMDRRVGRSPPSWAAVCVPRAAHSDPQRRFSHRAR